MRATSLVHLALVISILAFAAGCGGEPATELQAPQRVESPGLGIALAALPRGFVLESDGEGGIVLGRHPELPPGTVTIEATEAQQAGVNLVVAVNDQKTRIESLPEGKFQGQTELAGPTGRAYLTRGRYLEPAGTRVEELRIFTLHPEYPAVNRMLTLTYVYPAAGDSTERAEQIMEVLGEVEALTPASEPA